MNKILRLLAVLSVVTTTACNSNDDEVEQGVLPEGITITDDVECCTAEEALDVYNFLQTLKPVEGLATEVDGKYDVTAYSPTGSLHVGYNDLYFVVTKKATGNYVKYTSVKNFIPLMNMTRMNMWHSTPTSVTAESFSLKYHAVLHGWVSFLMSSSDNGYWVASYDVEVLGSTGSVNQANITVNALPEGQEWLKSFKVGDTTYYLSLVNPNSWQTGSNTIQAYVSKQSSTRTEPYLLAEETFIIEIDPRMPDMGNHSSPNNEALTKRVDDVYRGTINLTMTGRWRIHLTVKNQAGEIVAGGDDLDEGFSSLWWDVTI